MLIKNILGTFQAPSRIVSTPNRPKLVSTGSAMTHKKNPGVRLLIFCLSLIRYNNITATRSPLITSLRSFWSPPFWRPCIRSPTFKDTARRRNACAFDIRKIYICSLYANLLIGRYARIFIYLFMRGLRNANVDYRSDSCPVGNQIWVKLKFKFGQSEIPHRAAVEILI